MKTPTWRDQVGVFSFRFGIWLPLVRPAQEIVHAGAEVIGQAVCKSQGKLALSPFIFRIKALVAKKILCHLFL